MTARLRPRTDGKGLGSRSRGPGPFAVRFALPLLLGAAAPSQPATRPVATAPHPTFVHGTPLRGATLVRRYPHDTGAFTEGLLWMDGALYESTGMEGRSDIRRVRLSDGKVLARATIDPTLFGEGIAAWKDALISMTWRSGIGFRWDRSTLKQTATFRYAGEGWGMTTMDGALVQSDGTDVLHVRDPETFAERRAIQVRLADGTPVVNLNELEYVKGELLANIWQTATIARIDPKSGRVTQLVDLRPLREAVHASGPDAVLNGIAYDAAGNHLYVTGKNWPALFEIRLQ